MKHNIPAKVIVKAMYNKNKKIIKH